MVEDAKFWVVEPRITLSGVSGLSTLLSGNYIGFQAGKSNDSQTQFVGARRAAVITGPARPAVRAQGQHAGLAGRRLAGLLPPAQRRPGGGLQPRPRRQVGRDQGVRQRAVRQVRHPGDALLERERHRRLARRGRRQRPHGVARRADRGRRRVRHARLRDPRRAGRREHRVHALSRPRHRDEAAGPRRAALRALFQRVGARAVGRRAGDALRPARSARSPTSVSRSIRRRLPSARAC